MARFEHAHPGVRLVLAVHEPVDALRRVRAGDGDLAVAFTHRPVDRPVDDDALAWSVLGTDPFRLVLPPGHRLARCRRLRPADLAPERFCAPPREGTGVTYHEMLDALGADGGFQPTVAHTVGDVDVARALVAAGLGVAVMGQHTIPPGDTSVVTRPLPGGRVPARTIVAAWRRDRRLPALDLMLPLLRAAAAGHLATTDHPA